MLVPPRFQVGEASSIESGRAVVCEGAQGTHFNYAVSIPYDGTDFRVGGLVSALHHDFGQPASVG